jgi:hypothetical protein
VRFTRNDPRYQGANSYANIRAARGARACFAKACNARAIALAWLLQRFGRRSDPGHKAPALSRRKFAAANVSLSAEAMQQLEAALSPEKISAPRYSPSKWPRSTARVNFRISSAISPILQWLEDRTDDGDILKISERLCERGLLKCTGIDRNMPRYELTLAGRIEVERLLSSF